MPFQLLPLPFLAYQETSAWNSGIWGGQHRNIRLLKCRQESDDPFASGGQSPSQEGKPPCPITLHSLLQPAYLVHPPGCGAWISPPKSGLTLLCMCLPGQPRPQGTVPSSWPWSPSACQTPSRRQGTTDPGELWEQRRLAGAISNPECSGQLPRLCSDFWCSLESSHYITERSTIKYYSLPYFLITSMVFSDYKCNIWPTWWKKFVKYKKKIFFK